MTELKGRKRRISAKIREAVRLTVEAGLTRPQAAERCGITDNHLYKQLRRSDVLALRSELLGVLRESARARTIAKAEQLMDGAESEHVRLDAIRYLNPNAERSENLHLHQHSTQLPGLTIIYNPPSPEVLEAENVERARKGLKPLDVKTWNPALDVQVPHPALSDNPELIEQLPPKPSNKTINGDYEIITPHPALADK